MAHTLAMVVSLENQAMVKPYVAVIGTSEPTPGESDLAHRVGVLLARAGAVLVSGGLGGVMETSCRGSFGAGGTTVGVLPGEDRSDGNQFLTVALPTGLGQLRNGLVVAAADAVIAIGGGWGTLTEIGFAMRVGKPLIALSTWSLTSPHPSDRPIATADSAEEAVGLALDAAGAGRS
jgi:uncharacterized protein (TIGR00725 family)